MREREPDDLFDVQIEDLEGLDTRDIRQVRQQGRTLRRMFTYSVERVAAAAYRKEQTMRA